ncbi:response regulator receiver protein [[Clostridium] cellulosi]|jgi:CobQ/CobB/MinD/ParA nucleotide binding domain./Response regulator receiver domain.|uniref:Response regulator receiver protein n=1 Tax=[Clostridium] cellulosi TaxID=29343 RepID=A0A078KM09_9FIRM|nr:MAG: histidine kinase [[Clostridium] cellulosi]CDZ23478.1 response regulator receiver protein [[Clostridium] cellulosi]
MKLRVLIFSSDDTSGYIHSLLSSDQIELVGNVKDENIVLDEISRKHPDIILVVVTDYINKALRTCQQIYLLRPRTIPVVLSDENDPINLRKIMQTGVHYILPLSIDSESLIEQLHGIYSNEMTRIIAMENTAATTWKSKLIVVFGAQGGIGKTALAANLAVKLAQRKRKVMLLDYDLQFGDLNVFMGIDSKDTISDLLQEQSNPNADTIRRFCSLHASGVNLLSNPRSPEFAEGISVMQTERIAASLRSYYDYVIVDTATSFSDINLSCFDAASEILFVTDMDIAALRNSKKALTVLKSLVDDKKIKLIIGKQYPGNISIANVANALEMPIWASIPYDQKTMVDALNQGIPVVLDAPNSKISKAYTMIANQLDQSTEPEKNNSNTKKGLFRK